MTDYPENFDPKSTEDDYEIHALLPLGLTLTDADPDVPGGWSARPITVPFGSSIVITRRLRESNRNRLGISWVEYSSEQQLAEYKGRPRFGFGPVPESIRAQVRAARRAEVEQQRRTFLANNHVAARFAAEKSFLASLDAELAAIDGEGVGS